MTSKYMRSGSSVVPVANASLQNSLNGGTYAVRYDERSGTYSLEVAPSFTVPDIMYGNINKMTGRILETFISRSHFGNKPTGVLLSGTKGSGKTLLAKNISVVGSRDYTMSTILVNNEFYGEAFNTFIQSITEPCIVIFDEFEKVYESQNQEKILTLLDGTAPSQKLYILTCNDTGRIDQNMSNRPGRIYYNLEYLGVEKSDVIDFCQRNLQNKNHIDSVVDYVEQFNIFTFDMLSCLVEEMNRFGETVEEVVKYINVNLDKDPGKLFSVQVTDIVTGAPCAVKANCMTATNLPSQNDRSYIYLNSENEDDDDSYVYLSGNMLISKIGDCSVYSTGKYRVTYTLIRKA